MSVIHRGEGPRPLLEISCLEIEVLLIALRQYLEPEAKWRRHGPSRAEAELMLTTLRHLFSFRREADEGAIAAQLARPKRGS